MLELLLACFEKIFPTVYNDNLYRGQPAPTRYMVINSKSEPHRKGDKHSNKKNNSSRSLFSIGSYGYLPWYVIMHVLGCG